jgi:hypothetical protein
LNRAKEDMFNMMNKSVIAVLATQALADVNFTVGGAFDIDFSQEDCHLSIKNTSSKNTVFESSNDLV